MTNSRDYKEFSTGEWYHLFSRGNGKMDILRDDEDARVFLDRLMRSLGRDVQGAPLHTGGKRVQIRIEPFERDAFSIAVYCLMPNHFHFLIRQNKDVSISKLFLKLLTSYSMYFNRKYDHVGHVFQDRIKAVHVVDDTQLKHLSAYIHVNPQVAKLVRDARKWPHSSYAEYLSPDTGGLCDTATILEHFKSAREYQRFVEDAFDDIVARKSTVRELMLDEV